jgi:hypothetical protein
VNYGFATNADAIKWTRCGAIVWFEKRRKCTEKKLVDNLLIVLQNSDAFYDWAGV